ncbi:hypothetical protein C0V75_21920 [Tabrizicola sp. TH137]|nr:hypothetical protein C0V75_21920 [Tabrizicola sp. TH137]
MLKRPDVIPKTPFVAALRAVIDPRRSWIGYLVAVGTGLAVGITLLEPSASAHLSPFQRLLLWIGQVGVALVILECVQLGLGRTAIARHVSPLLLVILGGVIGAILFSSLSILLLEGLLAGPDPEDVTEDISMASLLAELRDSAGQVVVFWVLLNAPRLIMIARDQEDGSEETDANHRKATETPSSTQADPARSTALVELVSRLPSRLGTDIVAMTAELHYLRVYTWQGNALILMSFGRAVAALQVVSGMAVHRSHWVALNHVTALETGGDKVVCRMDTGLTVPVSRNNRAALRQALSERNQGAALRGAAALAASGSERA